MVVTFMLCESLAIHSEYQLLDGGLHNPAESLFLYFDSLGQHIF